MSDIVQYRSPLMSQYLMIRFVHLMFVLILQNWIQFYLTTNLALQLECM